LPAFTEERGSQAALGSPDALNAGPPRSALPAFTEEHKSEISSITITGDPFVWFLSIWPILTLFLLLNLSWAAFILAKRRWLESRFWLIAPVIWLVAISIDFAHH
jgi:hypothetical protein